MSSLKVINIGDPGTGFRFGGDDLDTVNMLLSGQDLGYNLKMENPFYFGGANKLRILRPDGIHYISINTEAETNSWAILVPPLTADQRMVFESLNQPLTNKSINFANNTPTNFPGAAINDNSITNAKLVQITDGTKIGTGLITSTHINDGTIVDGDINAGANIAHSKIGTNLKHSETGLTGVRTVTHPDVSYKAIGEANTAVVTNKELDFKKNKIMRLERVGWYSCSSSVIDAGGILSDMVGFGNLTVALTVAGKYHKWSTNTGIANDMAGVCCLAHFASIRWHAPLLMIAFRAKPNTSNNRAYFMGWGSQAIVANSDTEPLTAVQSGFLFGHGASDTQWQIFRNDATGTCQKTTTGINLPATETDYILEIEADNTLTQFKWTLWDVVASGVGNVGSKNTQLGTGTFNTRIPGQSTALYFQNTLYNTLTTPAEDNQILGVEVFTL